jgi:hypothetical protein
MSWRDVLKIHPACVLFPPLPPDELKALGEDIKKNRLQERAKLLRQGDKFVLLDGRSRLDAIEVAGLSIKVFEGNTPNNKFFEVVEVDNPIAFVISANVRRRHLTGEQKRDLIAMLLKRQPEKSDRQVAATVGVHHSTVGSVRTGLEGRGEISHVETKTDTKGRRQPAHKSSVGSPRKRRHSRKPGAPLSDAEPPVVERKFTTSETLTDITWAIAALVRSIADTTPAEVVAESDPAALVRLAGDAGLASAWLAALEVLAASAARRCDAGQGAPPIASGEAVGTQATPAASVAPEASHRGGAL